MDSKRNPNGENVFSNIIIIRTIVLAIITTNLPLIGIYAIPNEWRGILIKIVLAGLILITLRNYFLDPYWKGIGGGILWSMILLSGIWFSGIWFYPLHRPPYIFSFLYVTSIGTIVHMLKKDKEQINEFVEKNKKHGEKENKAIESIERGTHYFKLGEYEKAIENYTQAIKCNPDYAKLFIYYDRGICYFLLGKYEEAVEDYTQAIKYRIDDAEAYYSRGVCYGELGKFDKAIEDYTKAIKYKPSYAKAYFNRGNYYADSGEYNKAMNDFNQSIKYEPEYAAAYFNRGMCHKELGEYDKANKDIEKATKLNLNSK